MKTICEAIVGEKGIILYVGLKTKHLCYIICENNAHSSCCIVQFVYAQLNGFGKDSIEKRNVFNFFKSL